MNNNNSNQILGEYHIRIIFDYMYFISIYFNIINMKLLIKLLDKKFGGKWFSFVKLFAAVIPVISFSFIEW